MVAHILTVKRFLTALRKTLMPAEDIAIANGAPPAQPTRRPRGLVREIVEKLGESIRVGQLQPADKLPTEAEIMVRFDVSRTVVREALSKLQASGLVETRHGIGTFVSPRDMGGNFKISAQDFATVADVIAVLELRIGLETEAAGKYVNAIPCAAAMSFAGGCKLTTVSATGDTSDSATYAKLAYTKAQADRVLADQAAAERSLQQRINQITGVVAVGLFAARPADLLLIGTADAVRRISRSS